MTIHNRIAPLIADRLMNRPQDTYLMASLTMDRSPNLDVIIRHVDGDVICAVEVNKEVRTVQHHMQSTDTNPVIVDLGALFPTAAVSTYINGAKIATAQFLNVPLRYMHDDLKAFLRK